MEFYIDASVPLPVARALELVRDDIHYPEQPGCPVDRRGMHDVDWIPIVAAEGWIAIMRDRHIRTRTRERQALTDAGMRAFCMTKAGNASRWEILCLLSRFWLDIAHAAARPGPYIYGVTTAGLRPLRVPTK